MADLTVWRHWLPNPTFPPLCMRCAKPSTVIVPHRFVDYFESTRMNRATVPVPLCDRHKNMWLKRSIVMGVAFGAPVVCVIAPFISADLKGAICGVPPLLVFALTVIFTWRRMAIHACHFDLRKIVLRGVAEDFADVVQQNDLLGRLQDLQ